MTRAMRAGLLVGTVVVLSGTAAWADSFTLSPASPTLPTIPAGPADILYDVPGPALHSVGVPFGALGLVAGDVVDAISDGFDPVAAPHINYFSVSPASVGAPGSGVAAEVAADTAPGLTPGHASDIFIAGGGVPLGTNILAPAGFGWTLGTTTGDEANAGLVNPGDNVNAYDLAFLPPGGPIYFSLAAGSPSLIAGGFTPSDIFVGGAGAFGMFFPGAALGLPPAADLDALALLAPGFAPGSIEYSLSAATAGLVGVSPADILGLGGGPAVIVVHTAASIGLLATDNLDALDVAQGTVPEPATLGVLATGLALLTLRRRRD